MFSKIYVGDVRAGLAQLEPESVQVCVTSPPYHGLRSYQTTPQVWGGVAGCAHEWVSHGKTRMAEGASAKQLSVRGTAWEIEQGSTCAKCGAWRGELGSEPTPELFVEHLVGLAREWRRVLHPSGLLFLNIGDSYANWDRTTDKAQSMKNGAGEEFAERIAGGRLALKGHAEIKDGDLMLVPFMLALALRKDGWWLRSDIIWAKALSFCEEYSGTCMPESVMTRFTKSHEYVFMLAKKPGYFFDMHAVMEPQRETSLARQKRGVSGENKLAIGAPGQTPHAVAREREHDAEREVELQRHPRTVWAISTAAGRQKGPDGTRHYAAMPEKLAEICIKAGSSAGGCCPQCLAPYKRVLEREKKPLPRPPQEQEHMPESGRRPSGKRGNRTKGLGQYQGGPETTVGWQPTCKCPHVSPIECTVAEPFLGSGTTLAVAAKLGRMGVGSELNRSYAEMARKRILGTGGLFVAVEVVDGNE